MKELIVVGLLAATAVATSDYESMFKAFKATHLKAYANEAEEAKRFKLFVENMKMAEVLQAANPHASFGANAFADISAAEFKSHHNGEQYYKVAMVKTRNEAISSPAERMAATGQRIDWRTKGAVTGVKNQGQCGSCWSFSATGNIEGQWFLAGNKLTSLSEQELVSCDTIDDGCNGGLMDNAFKWLLQSRGGSIVTEASLPYTSGEGAAPGCPARLSSLPIGATIKGYKDVQKSEDAMAAHCYASGPVAIALDATSFQTYTGGILTNCISQQIDHGVLIVGFDDTNVPPYWIIKNSWGPSWGEGGYIRVAKGSNQCLITSYPTSAIVASKKDKVTAAALAAAPAFITYTQTYYEGQDTCTGPSNATTYPVNNCNPDGSGYSLAQCSAGLSGAPDNLIVVQYSDEACLNRLGTYVYFAGACNTAGLAAPSSFTCNTVPTANTYTQTTYLNSCIGPNISTTYPVSACMISSGGLFSSAQCVAGDSGAPDDLHMTLYSDEACLNKVSTTVYLPGGCYNSEGFYSSYACN